MSPHELAARIAKLLADSDDAQDPQFQTIDVDDRTSVPVVSVWLSDGTELFVEVHDD